MCKVLVGLIISVLCVTVLISAEENNTKEADDRRDCMRDYQRCSNSARRRRNAQELEKAHLERINVVCADVIRKCMVLMNKDVPDVGVSQESSEIRKTPKFQDQGQANNPVKPIVGPAPNTLNRNQNRNQNRGNNRPPMAMVEFGDDDAIAQDF